MNCCHTEIDFVWKYQNKSHFVLVAGKGRLKKPYANWTKKYWHFRAKASACNWEHYSWPAIEYVMIFFFSVSNSLLLILWIGSFYSDKRAVPFFTLINIIWSFIFFYWSEIYERGKKPLRVKEDLILRISRNAYGFHCKTAQKCPSHYRIALTIIQPAIKISPNRIQSNTCAAQIRHQW